MAKQRSESVFSMDHSSSHSGSSSDGRVHAEPDGLAFTVALSDPADGERVLGRAASAPLARAIFIAACTEYPSRRVILKRGEATLQDTGSGA